MVNATHVEEKEFELPLISVRVSDPEVVVEDSPDPFAKGITEIRENYSGASTGFKRRTTNVLKKVYDGVDGAESKAIVEEEQFNGYMALDVAVPAYNLDYLVKLYDMSDAHFAAVNAKVSNIVGLGYNLIETDRTQRRIEAQKTEEKKSKILLGLAELKTDLQEALESFNKEDSLTETFVKIWRDYEITGNGYIEVGRKNDGQIGYIGHIPSHTMRIRRKRDGYVQLSHAKMQFFANFGDTAPDPENGGEPDERTAVTNPVNSDPYPNEVIHIKKYSPSSTYYGVPDIIPALNAIAGDKFAAQFNLDYFENKAVPRHIVTLKGARLGGTDEQNLLEFFETSIKGQNHRTLFIPLPGDTDNNKVEFNVEPVETGVQDFSFGNYRKANQESILMVHRTPPTKAGVNSDINLAVAQDADKTFKEQVCGPEQKMFESKVNKIIYELTDSFRFALNEMTLTDADTQSQIDDRNIKNGSSLANEVRAKRGEPAVEGGDTRVDLNAGKLSTENTTTRARTQTRTDNATDSKGGARNPKGSGRTPGTE